MLRVLSTPRRLCAGPSRRDFLLASATPLLVGAGAHAAPAAKAKSCILLFLYGSPSQLETFDPKPDAPAEVRGELKAIRSNVPGVLVNELLPHTSRVMDKLTVVRSVTHPYPIHGVAYALTGVPTTDVSLELSPQDARNWPFVGSVVEKLAGPGRRGVPGNVALPFPFSSQRVGEVQRAGPYPAFLGPAFAPLWTEFRGEATVPWTKTLTDRTLEMREPYMGVSADSHFAPFGAPTADALLTLDRLDRRRSLSEQFERARRDLGGSPDPQRQRAFDVIGSDAFRTALDVRQEPRGVREQYGLTLFGQGALAARRLTEAGAKFVSVFWDEYGLAGSGWDTHWQHFPRMKNELMPGFDRALSGLLTDLDQRGRLDETLVLVLSEHGRTPKLQNENGGGRDHWSRAYSAVLAGGGIARGKVVGRTDKLAGDVLERPVSPKDLLATAYHLLGINPETTLTDRTGRPQPLVFGEVVPEVLA